LHSSQNSFSLHITTLHHPPLQRKQSTIAPQNSFVVISSRTAAPSKLTTGNAETLHHHDEQRQFPRRLTPSYTFTTATDTRVDHKDTYSHGQDCFCGGEYVTREEENRDNNDNEEEGFRGYSDDDSEKSREDDSPQAVASDWPSIGTDVSPFPYTQVPGASTSITRVQQVPNLLAPSSFYHHEAHLSQRADRGYSVDAYYAQARANVNGGKERYEECLMLYRDPLAWRMMGSGPSVGDHTARGSEKHAAARSTGELAMVDRKQIEGVRKKLEDEQATLAALRKSATRRVSEQKGPRHPHSPSTTQSRNPFRRQVPRGPQLLALSQQQDRTTEMDASHEPRGAVKPLKPISTVKVPSLPSELRHQSCTKGTAKKENKMGGFSSSDSKAVKSRAVMDPSTLKRLNWMSSVGEVKSWSSANQEGERKRQRRSFDWSAWAAQGK